MTDAPAVESWAKEVLAELGPPDLLINNAAVMNPLAPLWAIPAADFDKVMDVNVKGVVNAIRAFVPAMIDRKRGDRKPVERVGPVHGAGSGAVLCVQVRG